jgi:hypothetical protein
MTLKYRVSTIRIGVAIGDSTSSIGCMALAMAVALAFILRL